MCTDLQVFNTRDGRRYEVPCRKCKRCEANRLNDFMGRCYAEALTSDAFTALTLTYAGEKANTQYLTYDDVQRFFKRIRKDGYENGYTVRYFITGEYGTKRGRAHWHCILYIKGDIAKLCLPPPDTECQMWKFWPHGFTYVQQPDFYGLLYVLKYAAKDDGSEKTSRKPGMSKKPPMGAAYWKQLAARRIAAGLPFSRKYTLPGATYKNKKQVEYYLKGASLDLAFWDHVALWRSRSRQPVQIANDDIEACLEIVMRPIKRVEPVTIGQPLCWTAHPAFDRALVLRDGYLVRLTTGFLFHAYLREGVWLSWPVATLADAIALYRGRKVPSGQTRALLTTHPPF